MLELFIKGLLLRRVLFSAIPLFFLVGVGIIQYRIHGQLASDSKLLETRPQFDEAPTPPFLLAYQENEWAAYLREDLFPPNLEAALEANQRGLFLDPMSSNTWMSISETKLYQGDLDASRIALERSDMLDPNYPRERLESIQLWKMLGEEEKALQHAKRLASLGGNNAVDVARELQKSAFNLEQILETIRYDQLASAEVTLVAEALSQNGKNLPALWKSMNPDLQNNARAQSRFAQFSLRSNPEFAHQVWNIRTDALQTLGDRLVMPSPSLNSLEFDSEFPLGWETPQSSQIQMRLLADKSDEECSFIGALEFEPTRKKGRSQKIKLGTFILLKGEEIQLRVPYLYQGIEQGSLSMEMAQDGKFHIIGSQELSDRCDAITFTIPASELSAPISFSLLLNIDQLSVTEQQVIIAIDGFELVGPQ